MYGAGEMDAGGLNEIPEDDEDEEEEVKAPEPKRKRISESEPNESVENPEETPKAFSVDFFESYIKSYALINKLSELFGHTILRTKKEMDFIWQ